MTIKNTLLVLFFVSQCFFVNSIMSADDQKNDQKPVIVEQNEALINVFEEYGKVSDKELAERKKMVDEFFKPLLEYANRPQDGLDHFVKTFIDTDLSIRAFALLGLLVGIFLDRNIGSSNHLVFDRSYHSLYPVGYIFAFMRAMVFSWATYGAYNGLRFAIEKILPARFVNGVREKLLSAEKFFPSTIGFAARVTAFTLLFKDISL